MPGIALLGWGSLLWDKRPKFDNNREEWLYDGPVLNIEFSRVSKKARAGALTLVLDDKNGSPCQVAYALSKRTELEDAISDLQLREGTTRENIGVIKENDVFGDCADSGALNSIRTWAKYKELDAVLWTNLPPNFQQKTGREFTVQNAIQYIENLDQVGKCKAKEYFHRAPSFVMTPLRLFAR